MIWQRGSAEVTWLMLLALGMLLHVLIPPAAVTALAPSAFVTFVSDVIPSIDAWAVSSPQSGRARLGLVIQWLLIIPLVPASWRYLSSSATWTTTIRALSLKRRIFGAPFMLLLALIFIYVPEVDDLQINAVNGIGIHHMVSRLALKNSMGLALVGAMTTGAVAVALAYAYGLVRIRQNIRDEV